MSESVSFIDAEEAKRLIDAGNAIVIDVREPGEVMQSGMVPGAVNVHFCDGFAGGELHFDYTMRPGVVPHGNGLALMRAVGLKV